MKKLLTFVATLTLICALFLTGCVNQGMADKINEKAKSEDGYTYAQLLEDYKDPTIKAIDPITGIGMATYVSGCKNNDEAVENYEKGKKLKAVRVYITFNKVTNAEYIEDYTPIGK